MKKIVACIIVILCVSLIAAVDQYRRIQRKLELATANLKAYDKRLSSTMNANIAYRLTVDQLKHSQDSVMTELNKVRKELGIKDKRLQALGSLTSSFSRVDTVLLKDTIFRDSSLSLDTVIGDEWYQAYLGLRYPGGVILSPEFKSEKYIVVSTKRETINPPKKFFLLRWLQKKQNVLNIDVIERNPYVKEQKSNYIEILK